MYDDQSNDILGHKREIELTHARVGAGDGMVLGPPGVQLLAFGPSPLPLPPLAPPGSSWLLLAPWVPPWLLLAAPGSPWLLLAALGFSWLPWPPGSSSLSMCGDYF